MLVAARLSTTLPITAPAPTSFVSAIFIDSSILVVAPTKERYNNNNQSNNNEHVAPPRHGMVAPPVVVTVFMLSIQVSIGNYHRNHRKEHCKGGTKVAERTSKTGTSVTDVHAQSRAASQFNAQLVMLVVSSVVSSLRNAVTRAFVCDGELESPCARTFRCRENTQDADLWNEQCFDGGVD